MNRRILCVEDEIELLDTIHEFLSQFDYDIVTANHGAEALELVKNSEPFDMILCDISMPKMDGFEFLKSVRQMKNYVATPFIFMTALSQKEDMIKAHRLGCDEYVTKPVDLDVLEALVESRMHRREIIGEYAESNETAFQQLILQALSVEMMEPTNAVVVTSSFISQSLKQVDDEMLDRRFGYLYQNAAQQLAMLQQLNEMLSGDVSDKKNIADYPCAMHEIVSHIQRLLEVQGALDAVKFDCNDTHSLICDPFLISKAFSNLLSRATRKSIDGKSHLQAKLNDISGRMEWLACDASYFKLDQNEIDEVQINSYKDFVAYSEHLQGTIIAALFLYHVAQFHDAELTMFCADHQLLGFKMQFPVARCVKFKMAI